MLLRLEQEVSALGATIKKRREELQEVTHSNAVEMDAIKTKAAEATAKAKEDHERKVSSARGGAAHVFDCSKTQPQARQNIVVAEQRGQHNNN